MIFSHFPQAKPATTAFNPSVTVTSDVVRNYRRFPTLHHNEEVGADPVGRNLIPPVVSYPGHFNAILCRITLAAYPITDGFEIRFLYVYGNAQVGFSPFVTELYITSAHTHCEECFLRQKLRTGFATKQSPLLRGIASLKN